MLLVLAPLTLSALLTVAAAVALDLPFNFANIIALPLLLGLGVSGGIHLVLRWREMGSVDRILASSTPRAVLFSALTTAAAFGSLAVSDHLGMSSMGQLLSITIVCTLVAMLIVLPALLALTTPRPAGPSEGTEEPSDVTNVSAAMLDMGRPDKASSACIFRMVLQRRMIRLARFWRGREPDG